MTRRILALAAILFALFGHAAHADDPARVAVVIGANDGMPGDEPLRYADRDARRVRDLLVELGGVRADRALFVQDGDRAAVQRALDEARGRVAELAATGQSVLFLFYYSGHGDAGSLHMAQTRLARSELRAQIERIPARMRVVVIDACRTGGAQKGVRAGPSFALSAAEETHGIVELSASTAGEAAQESEELGGAVFTHFLLSGLRGAADLDGDGRVTLLEAYSYAYRRTLLRTSGGELLQHPSWAASLAGSGELLLSFPARAGLTLELPRGADRYLVFTEKNATPMGEVSGDGQPKIALPPGRYFVTRRAPGRNAVALADGTWGGFLQLRKGDFRLVSDDQLILRGGRLEVWPWRVDVKLGGEWVVGAADAGGGRFAVAVERFRGPLAAVVELSYTAAGVGTPTLVGVAHSLGAQGALGVRLVRSRVSFAGQLGLELRGTFERLEQREASRARAAGYGTAVDRDGLAGGPRLELSLGVALGHHVTALAWTSAMALVRDEHDDLGATKLVVRAAVGGGLGIARAF